MKPTLFLLRHYKHVTAALCLQVRTVQWKAGQLKRPSAFKRTVYHQSIVRSTLHLVFVSVASLCQQQKQRLRISWHWRWLSARSQERIPIESDTDDEMPALIPSMGNPPDGTDEYCPPSDMVRGVLQPTQQDTADTQHKLKQRCRALAGKTAAVVVECEGDMKPDTHSTTNKGHSIPKYTLVTKAQSQTPNTDVEKTVSSAVNDLKSAWAKLQAGGETRQREETPHTRSWDEEEVVARVSAEAVGGRAEQQARQS